MSIIRYLHWTHIHRHRHPYSYSVYVYIYLVCSISGGIFLSHLIRFCDNLPRVYAREPSSYVYVYSCILRTYMQWYFRLCLSLCMRCVIASIQLEAKHVWHHFVVSPTNHVACRIASNRASRHVDAHKSDERCRTRLIKTAFLFIVMRACVRAAHVFDGAR